MNELRFIIGKNIYELRCNSGLTQLELAEKLHYSDKAVSKWEKGDSIPEISTLISIAELFEVSLDYLVNEHTEKKDTPETKSVKIVKIKNRAIISAMSILLIWFIASFAFFMTDIFTQDLKFKILPYVYAVPITMLVWLIFNSIWFNVKRNYLIISLLMWSSIAVVYITFCIFGFVYLWKMFILGIPAQIIIILWSKIKVKKQK